MKIALIFLLLIALSTKQCSCEEENLGNENFAPTTSEAPSKAFYTAAVVEFNAPGDMLSDPEEIVEANLAEYLKYIEEASENGVDILVFPEAALNYNGISSYDNLTEMAVDIHVEVPDVSDCSFTHDVILGELSFAAANASIYVLVNVVELEPCNDTDSSCKNGFKLFNSNIVFDRNGCIISRYRKFNLFVEPHMSVTSSPDISTFETDFGVTFGHFVCFDILFKSPALDLVSMNVKHFLYPSMWFSETPFLTSLQIQQAFAGRHNIVLLSAGTNSPLNSNTGSGIFIGKHGGIEKIISFKNESRMIISEIPKNVNDPDYQPPSPTIEPYTPNEMNSLNLWSYEPPMTYPLSEHLLATSNNVTCEFSLNFTLLENNDRFTYQLAVFSGTRSYAGIINGGEVHCAIIACDAESCGRKFGDKSPSVQFHEINIKMVITEDDGDYLVMPSTLQTSVVPMRTGDYDFRFETNDEKPNYQMTSRNTRDLLTFGIYGRHFSLDNRPTEQEAPTESPEEHFETTVKVEELVDDEINDFEIKMTIYIVLMVFLSIITAIMVRRKLRDPYVKPDLNKRRRSSL